MIYRVHIPTAMLKGIDIVATPGSTNSSHFPDKFSHRRAVSVFVAHFYPLFSDCTVWLYPLHLSSAHLSPCPIPYQTFDTNNPSLSFPNPQWKHSFLKLPTTHHRGRFRIPTSYSTVLLIPEMFCLKLQSHLSIAA